MSDFDEQRQCFHFDDQQWSVVKYDEHPDYVEKIRRLNDTKGVDFIGLHKRGDEVLYWIEVKDFRGYRIQNKSRLTTTTSSTSCPPGWSRRCGRLSQMGRVCKRKRC